MTRSKKISKTILILFVLAFTGAIIPAASAALPCCPQYADYPSYYYPVDPYYRFPSYCYCPFLDDALNRSIWKNTPAYYWEWVIASGNSSCSTCGNSATSSSVTYSNTALIIPEKEAVMYGYDQISISTSIASKEQAIAKQRNAW